MDILRERRSGKIGRQQPAAAQPCRECVITGHLVDVVQDDKVQVWTMNTRAGRYIRQRALGLVRRWIGSMLPLDFSLPVNTTCNTAKETTAKKLVVARKNSKITKTSWPD